MRFLTPAVNFGQCQPKHKAEQTINLEYLSRESESAENELKFTATNSSITLVAGKPTTTNVDGTDFFRHRVPLSVQFLPEGEAGYGGGMIQAFIKQPGGALLTTSCSCNWQVSKAESN